MFFGTFSLQRELEPTRSDSPPGTNLKLPSFRGVVQSLIKVGCVHPQPAWSQDGNTGEHQRSRQVILLARRANFAGTSPSGRLPCEIAVSVARSPLERRSRRTTRRRTGTLLRYTGRVTGHKPCRTLTSASVCPPVTLFWDKDRL